MSQLLEAQVISRLLDKKNIGMLTLNAVDETYFPNYPEEYSFIINHFKEYGTVPDKETFINKFIDFDLIEVAETDRYLIESLSEEHLFMDTVKVLNQVSEVLQTDSYKAVELLQANLSTLLGKSVVTGTDIISDAQSRYAEYQKAKTDINSVYMPTGFKEVDEAIGGFHIGEELAVVFARTGQGKSWVVIKMLEHAWKMNKRVGLVEPEMSANKIGFRFDTIHHNISNKAMNRGYDIDGYAEYIQSLSKHTVPFFVSHPKEFKRNITVSKLRSFVESNKLDILCVDGISYLNDERKQKGDSVTTQLTHISEDLMDLSIDLKIPVIVVCQSNREGAKEDDLKLENIRDSDGIAYNSSIVFSVQQKNPGLILSIIKHRNGVNNLKFTYLWDIDLGKFVYVPSDTDTRDIREDSEELRRSYNDTGETF